MKLLKKERKIENLFNFFDEHENDIVKVVFKDRTVDHAVLDTMYENDDDNDEYNIILMKNIDDNTFFEISYKNVPIKIIFNGVNIMNASNDKGGKYD